MSPGCGVEMGWTQMEGDEHVRWKLSLGRFPGLTYKAG